MQIRILFFSLMIPLTLFSQNRTTSLNVGYGFFNDELSMYDVSIQSNFYEKTNVSLAFKLGLNSGIRENVSSSSDVVSENQKKIFQFTPFELFMRHDILKSRKVHSEKAHYVTRVSKPST